ncbi:MAG: type II secretion system protein [Deltaproteobacteria bacterium]|uniref:PulJ/GspJ family protein n=1 Tax=Desulfobacula sp. TaxID=2593537 RepID=UPI0019C6B5CC|nr:type II secretion system protein [Candidatus Desulfobacula maris]MBL6996000.1 type II secretion system protein [Desulfobacula sp.]
MIKLISNKSGFSLIELIVVMIISGLLVLFGSMGIMSAVNNYFSQKTNSETAYKGQLAIIRISKEFRNLTTVTSGQGTSTSIVYDIYRNGTLETHKLSWGGTSGDPLLYDDFSNNGNTLVDSVKDFKLEYYDAYNDTTPATSWTISTIMIGVTLELIGVDNISSVFTSKIAPRNLP